LEPRLEGLEKEGVTFRLLKVPIRWQGGRILRVTECHQCTKLETARAIGTADIPEGVRDVCRAGNPDAAMLKPEREVRCGMRKPNLDALIDPVMYPNPKARQLEDNISPKELSGEHNGQWREGSTSDKRGRPTLRERGDCSI
jgi:hypothetical protein